MWKLTVGSDDLTSYVTFLNLSETASSSQDSGSIAVNGSHSSIVPGASVTLTDANSNTAWEGYVLSSNPQANATGMQVATLANKCSVGYHYGSASGNDVAVLAQGLLGATNVPWGGPANLGLEVGGLSFDRVDSGLSLLAMLAGSTWRVQNGQCVFVNAVTGIADIPVALQTSPNAYSAVNILGGADINTRIPLSQTVTPIGSPLGPVGQVSHHEIADAGTLGILAANLGEMYGLGAVSASATLSQTVRAGDWVQDTNGIVTVAWQVKWSIVAGLLQAAVQFGFPALSQEPQYSPAFSDAMHRFPVSRLTSDYVVQGCSASISGSTISMGSGIIVISDALSSISGRTLTPSGGVSYITATSSGYSLSAQPLQPGSGVNLYRLSVTGGVIVGLTDIRQHGGSGSNNVQPNALYPVHFSGDTSGDRSVAIFNAATKTMNHVVMSQPTQARILSDNTLKVDGTTGPVSGTLPYLNHDAAFRSRILSDNTLKVDGATGPVSGNLPYSNTSTEYQGNFDNGGSAKKSSMFNTGIPNALYSLMSDVGLSYSSTTSSVSIWMTNAAGSSLPVWTYPDGSGTINPPSAACGSSGAPLKTVTGLTSGENVYFVVWYNVNTQTFTANNYNGSPPTDAQVASAVADGTILAVQASASSSNAVVANGGGGTKPGGGGHSYL